MSGYLDNAEIGISCPKCGAETKKSIGWIKHNNKFICACGSEVNFDSNQFRKKMAAVDSSLNDFGKGIKF